MTKLKQLFCAFALSSLAGCTHLTNDQTSSVDQQSDVVSATIWDSKTSQWVDEDTMIRGLQNAQYILVGELHHSQYLRDRLLDILKKLHHQKWLEVVAMDSLQSRLNTDELTWLEQLEKHNPNLVNRYKTLIEWLEQENIPVVAAAIPMDKLHAMKEKDARKWLKEQTRHTLSDEQISQLKSILSQNHSASEPNDEQTDYLLAAQQLQDYFMARMLVAVKENSVLITRAFHARHDMGLTPYIKAARPSARVKNLLLLSSIEDKDNLMTSLKEMSKQYDYIWLKSSEKGLMLAPGENKNSSEQNQ